jgi:hypothetical protein
MTTALLPQSSYTTAVAITPADGTPITASRALFFSATAAQTLRVTMAGGGVANFTFGAAGSYVFPVSVTTVEATGTTVTGILSLL